MSVIVSVMAETDGDGKFYLRDINAFIVAATENGCDEDSTVTASLLSDGGFLLEVHP